MNQPAPDVHDVIIIGAGPAGLAAGLYAARANLKTVILEKGLPGGQALLTWQVENYPGFPGGTGADLVALMEKQVRDIGCPIVRQEVTDIRPAGDIKEVITAAGVTRARGVIVAAGARPNALGVPGEREYLGRGVSYCATCDGAFFSGVPVAVVGGGDTAVEEACFLAKFAGRVHLIHRRDKLRAAKVIQDAFLGKENASVVWNSVVTEIFGNGNGVTGVRLKNVKTLEESRLEVQGVFVFVGITPNSAFLKGKVDMDQWGFIKTDDLCRTGVPGVFAAGDIRSKEMRQIVTAAAEGATAAYFLEKSFQQR